MLVGKVVGSVVATRKNENLVGNKFLIVQPMESMADQKRIVAIDNVGAGIGEIVLVTQGSAARFVSGGVANAPVDAAIVGIVDDSIGLE